VATDIDVNNSVASIIGNFIKVMVVVLFKIETPY